MSTQLQILVKGLKYDHKGKSGFIPSKKQCSKCTFCCSHMLTTYLIGYEVANTSPGLSKHLITMNVEGKMYGSGCTVLNERPTNTPTGTGNPSEK